ncbi:MAG: hypothetical protein R6U96_03680 [Promethearchaeia archaeon]
MTVLYFMYEIPYVFLFTEGCVFYLTTAYALSLTERGAKVLEFYIKCEKPTEQGIVEWRDFVELSFFICPSLCNQKMEVRMKVYPASE